ncbi:hypothetical protein REG_0800 [Candidatus Regiella insecticola LSR1]|uniref:Uncharacterized protein n=1 Tax=Candidatus Regiella insecticola LSR1 TaxID=663321 RepID=E0WS69_9ENTR|nr:hypothetical protein REG_0800 [Candidatus Regiella insecticola LSR1]
MAILQARESRPLWLFLVMRALGTGLPVVLSRWINACRCK